MIRNLSLHWYKIHGHSSPVCGAHNLTLCGRQTEHEDLHRQLANWPKSYLLLNVCGNEWQTLEKLHRCPDERPNSVSLATAHTGCAALASATAISTSSTLPPGKFTDDICGIRLVDVYRNVIWSVPLTANELVKAHVEILFKQNMSGSQFTQLDPWKFHFVRFMVYQKLVGAKTHLTAISVAEWGRPIYLANRAVASQKRLWFPP